MNIFDIINQLSSINELPDKFLILEIKIFYGYMSETI